MVLTTISVSAEKCECHFFSREMRWQDSSVVYHSTTDREIGIEIPPSSLWFFNLIKKNARATNLPRKKYTLLKVHVGARGKVAGIAKVTGLTHQKIIQKIFRYGNLIFVATIFFLNARRIYLQQIIVHTASFKKFKSPVWWKFRNRVEMIACSRGRVVKATDSKSVGIFPRRFKSCRLRKLWNWAMLSNFYSYGKDRKKRLFHFHE